MPTSDVSVEDLSSVTLEEVRDAACDCTRCPLYRHATQTVFGEGPRDAKIMLIGEQPGDCEDREGRPFVGPAGRMLDQCLAKAGLDRRALYLTNTVKHFKWVATSRKHRLHKKPSPREIAACRPWLDAELDFVRPELVIALGATAAQALMGPDFRVTRSRGQFFSMPWSARFMATVHPSSLLRAHSSQRQAGIDAFVADLRRAAFFVYPDRAAPAPLRTVT